MAIASAIFWAKPRTRSKPTLASNGTATCSPDVCATMCAAIQWRVNAAICSALDQATDPHNVGAILRSAVALGADAVVTTERHAPEEGPVLAKSASGALDMIRHVRVKNMARFVTEMRDSGFRAIALDSEGPARLEETPTGDRVLLVLGSEGKGVRQGVRENCDALARLDMPGKIASLNVSNAAVLALYIIRESLEGRGRAQ